MQNNPKLSIEQNKKVYNIIAPFFSSSRTYLWDDLKPLGKFVKVGDKILDLGCGNGRLYQLFEKNQVNYTGVDQSEKLIQIAKGSVPQGNFFISDMCEVPFEDNEFDIVYAIASFHHLPNKDARIKCLKEIKRVLKNDGMFIMTNWNLHSLSAKKKAETDNWKVKGRKNDFLIPWKNSQGEVLGKRYYYGFNMEELLMLFKEVGLSVIDQYFTTKGRKGGVTSSGNIITIAKK